MDSWFRQSQATSASASSIEDARNVPVAKVAVAPKPTFKAVTRRDVALMFAPRIAGPTGPSPSRPPASGRVPVEIETETIDDSQDSSAAAVTRKRAASTSRPREDVPKAKDAEKAKDTGDSATTSITQDVRTRDRPSTTTTAPAPASPERTSHRESRAKEKEDKGESRGRSGGRRGSDGKGAGDAADA